MLNLNTIPANKLRKRADELEAEAAEFDNAHCHHLARLKRRDAAFYRHRLQLRQA